MHSIARLGHFQCALLFMLEGAIAIFCICRHLAHRCERHGTCRPWFELTARQLEPGTRRAAARHCAQPSPVRSDERENPCFYDDPSCRQLTCLHPATEILIAVARSRTAIEAPRSRAPGGPAATRALPDQDQYSSRSEPCRGRTHSQASNYRASDQVAACRCRYWPPADTRHCFF